MATTTNKKRAIKYLNRDFESFKRDMIEHLRVYHPNTVQDFNESSVGIMLTELSAFIGDNMAFYMDKKFDESFIQTAREKKNIFKHAKQLGFRAFGKASASGQLDAFIVVPAIRDRSGKMIPDMRFAGTIKKGAKLKSNSGETYETLIDADFSTVNSNSNAFVAVAETDSETGEPKTFALKKSGIDIKAGETKSTTFSVGSYESFKRLTISEEDVLEILKITDSEANEWFEVEYLAQDTVFQGVANTGEDTEDVPFVLKLRSVPFRFISEYDIETNKTSITFGTGDAETFDGDLIPDLGDLSLPLFGRDTFTDFSLDPQNFLKTRTLGLAPVNTTLNVEYRVGGGSNTNAGAGEISTVVESTFDIGDTTLDTTTVTDVGNSFSVLNPNPIQGGRDEFSVEEVRHLISANFAAQSRMVTAQDFVVRTLSMPSKFGSVFRANARVNPLNTNAVELITLAKNSIGNVVVPSQELKVNLKKYLSRFRMLTDAIEILDGQVINVGVDFTVLVDNEFNKSEVLANCLVALKDFFVVDKWQINQPINKTDISTLLGSIPGVLSLVTLDILNIAGSREGRGYSLTTHNIKDNTRNGIVYAKENAIFEVKFPNKDITGSAK